MKYFYTFGSSATHPYFGGWVEIEAENRKLADAAFRREYPDKIPDMLNCAGVYTEKEFEKAGFKNHGNMGEFCHRKLNAADVLGQKVPVNSSDIPEFIGQIIDIFEDFLEEKGVSVDNPEKENSDDPAVIYGSDYGNISDDLKNLMAAWGITGKDGAEC